LNDDPQADVPTESVDMGGSNGESVTVTESGLAAELAAALAKAEEFQNKYLYAMADFENYKKRIERVAAETALAGKKSVLKKMLTVLDNLERALTFKDDSEGLRGGLAATVRVFESTLEGEGVKALHLKGQPFDPKFAEAIGTQATPDGVAENTILEEAQRAYLIGDDVLRPAMVIVASADA
jgi:molecular chaperone GrpE